jgi:hypothetical protein
MWAATNAYASVNPDRVASNSLASTSSCRAASEGQANTSQGLSGVIEVPAGFRAQLPLKAKLLDLKSNPWEPATVQLHVCQSPQFLHLALSFVASQPAARKSSMDDTARALWTALHRISTGLSSGLRSSSMMAAVCKSYIPFLLQS